MADKRQIRQSIKKLQRVKTWQLVLILILIIFVNATLLRLNNVGMVERRKAVISADEIGDDRVTQDRLYDLQKYVTSHMNTDMGKGMYLIGARKRDAAAIYASASNDSNPNGNIYKKAQEVCAPQFSSYSSAYLQCTMNELSKYPASSDLISQINLPSAEAYLRVYASPVWSPDFAGWSLVVSVVILIMIIVRITSVIILRIMLKKHYSSI
ncbi:hypothetical protein HGB24_01255 [Candidatus Saccharibacteria bacterium]|nr:hypothetical protein [Candidatus Saccharibacteria bacterium]